MLGSALGPAAQVSLTRRLSKNGKDDAEQQLADTMARAAEFAQPYPRLRERLGTPAATDYSAAPDHTFEFGLRAILDGFQAHLGASHDDGRGHGHGDSHGGRHA